MTMPPIDPGTPFTPNYAGPNTAPKVSGMAITSMILGITSACLSILTGIPAIVLGIISLLNINREPQRYSGKGYAITGIVTGCVGSFLCLPLLIAIL